MYGFVSIDEMGWLSGGKWNIVRYPRISPRRLRFVKYVPHSFFLLANVFEKGKGRVARWHISQVESS